MSTISKEKRPIVRFAPSPTGPFHVGGARSALFNYLYAKKNGGTLILRIEDTDKERSKKEYEQEIYDSFTWLGLSFDSVYRQSDRTEIYKKYLQKLIDSGVAYISKEKVEKEGDREEVIRFRNPGKKITFTDLIKGPIEFDTTDLGDFVIGKSLEEPLFHLAVVVDDFEMGITHIIRGEDHISNTPRQILIQEAIGAPRPEYAHLPLILAPDRSKLSKRKHGEAVSVSYYKKSGYLPEALLNFLALLGWNPGDSQEIFSLSELVSLFDLKKVQKGGAVFDVVKLDWMNKEYLKKLPTATIASEFKKSGGDIPDDRLLRALPTLMDHISKFSDIESSMNGEEYQWLKTEPSYPIERLFWKDEKDSGKTAARLNRAVEIIEKIDEKNFNAKTLKEMLWDFATQEGRGSVLWPLRVALSGNEKSPDPFVLGEILGKSETILRIKNAEKKLAGN